jgi:hypothetical protein
MYYELPLRFFFNILHTAPFYAVNYYCKMSRIIDKHNHIFFSVGERVRKIRCPRKQRIRRLVSRGWCYSDSFG